MSTNPLTELVLTLATRDWRRVAEAERELLAAGQDGRDAVIAGLGHPNPRVRRACAGFMDHHGDTEGVRALVAALSDLVPNVRREAVHSMACDRCKAGPVAFDTIPLLLGVIENDPNPKVRREAIYGLARRQKDARVLPALHRLLETETDPELRKGAHFILYHQDPEYRECCVSAARSGAGAGT